MRFLETKDKGFGIVSTTWDLTGLPTASLEYHCWCSQDDPMADQVKKAMLAYLKKQAKGKA